MRPISMYTGPASVEKLLEEYECTHPYPSVRAAMMGSIACVLPVSPQGCIASLWDYETPEFASELEMARFYDVLLGLWNSLAKLQRPGRQFAFVKRQAPRTEQEFWDTVRHRLDELALFLDGFLPDQDALLTPQLWDMVEELESQAEAMACLLDYLPESPGEREIVRAAAEEWTKIDAAANRLAGKIVVQAVRERKGLRRAQDDAGAAALPAALRLLRPGE